MALPCGTFNERYEEDMAIIRTKTQWLLVPLALAFLATLPLYLPLDWLYWFVTLGITIVAVLGLHILTGLCGQFSMGQAAFMAVGAYTAAILGGTHGLPAWGTLPLAGLLAGLVGLVFGAPALRIKGFYLVMSTIAAQFIVTWVLMNSESWTGGWSGIYVPAITVGDERLGDTGFWWLTLGLVLLAVVFTKNIQRTTSGRSFIAVRDNDLAAQVMGVNIFRTKMLAFFIGCFYAGIAGWLSAYYFLWLSPHQFTFNDSLWFLGMIIVGGLGSTTGAVMGATFIRLLDKGVELLVPPLETAFPDFATNILPALSLAVFSLIVMLFIYLQPRGLYNTWERLKMYYRLHPFSYWTD